MWGVLNSLFAGFISYQNKITLLNFLFSASNFLAAVVCSVEGGRLWTCLLGHCDCKWCQVAASAPSEMDKNAQTIFLFSSHCQFLLKELSGKISFSITDCAHKFLIFFLSCFNLLLLKQVSFCHTMFLISPNLFVQLFCSQFSQIIFHCRRL